MLPAQLQTVVLVLFGQVKVVAEQVVPQTKRALQELVPWRDVKNGIA
jgi:hypothetical protein